MVDELVEGFCCLWRELRRRVTVGVVVSVVVSVGGESVVVGAMVDGCRKAFCEIGGYFTCNEIHNMQFEFSNVLAGPNDNFG